jgi:hypothetical protein
MCAGKGNAGDGCQREKVVAAVVVEEEAVRGGDCQ